MCVEICRDCAESCRAFGDADMNRCAEICERCASSCDAMSTGIGAQRTTIPGDSRDASTQPFI
jgi:hypothetical protein